MAEITKAADASLVSLLPPSSHELKGIAGEDITAGDACRIHSDGKMYKSSGAAANTNANIDGFAAASRKAGQTLTLFAGERWSYCEAAQTSGKSLFLSGTVAGGLADTASTGGTAPCGKVLQDGKRVQLYAQRLY